MSRRSSSRLSKKTPARTPQELQTAPANPAPAFDPSRFVLPRRRLPGLVKAGILLAVGALITVIVLGATGWFAGSRVGNIDIKDQEVDLCAQFRLLKNAGDPAAEDLLPTPPLQPVGPISEDDASRFQCDCFLRQDIHIQTVRRDGKGRLVLVARGNVSAPTLQVRSAQGVDRIQRTMMNPALIVEVRGGKIHGVRAEVDSGT